MTLKDYYAGQALIAMQADSIVMSSIPRLAKAIDKDAEWREEMIKAVAKSAWDIADAMIAEGKRRG